MTGGSQPAFSRPPILGVCALATVAMTACSPSISPTEAEQVAADVKPLLEAMCVAGGPVEAARWPRSVRELDPASVQVRSDGLYVATASFFAAEWGLFIPCHPERFAPSASGDPSYKRVVDGIFTYYIAG